MLKMLLSEAKVPFGEAHPKKEKKTLNYDVLH